ncbi:MAG: HTH-type transcriptional activator IlvY [Motiliproteus sp.]|nr:HTH-type transcriptional activator IlvY [Motiliproteus sp.]MCW9052301.1 HTH-type transcriptional activator IlvY [Motiliproteus sp.]
MDIKPLKQFIALADSLHFGRASEICHVSPSTLSRSIKQLEDSLGVTLFERDNRSVSLTPEGVRFQQYARESLSQWDVLRHSLQQESGQLQGEVSIFCSVTASYSFLYEILSEFRLKHPKIEIKLHTGDHALAIPRVLAGDEDITIAAKPDQLPTGMTFKQIAVSPLIFIAPIDEPSLSEQLQGGSQDYSWQDLPMILSEEGLARKRVDQWFRKKGIKPKIYAQVAGHEAIVSMVSLGFGVGVVPKIVIDNSPLAANVQILDVEPALESFLVGLCAMEKKLKNPLIHALWSQIKEAK